VLQPRGYEQHRQLLEHFRAGDFEAFDALMRAHVIGTRDTYVASLKSRGAGDAAAPARKRSGHLTP
jgi:DNA-binding GntR family transcriptional regulator